MVSTGRQCGFRPLTASLLFVLLWSVAQPVRADVTLEANGVGGTVQVEPGEQIDLVVDATACPAEGDNWRDTWSDPDGIGVPDTGQQTFADSPCDRSPSRTFTAPATPGSSYDVTFQSEYCDGFFACFFGVYQAFDDSTVTIEVVASSVPAALLELRMDESAWNGTSGEVTDSSGNGFDGTARNGARTDDTSPAVSGDPGTCGYGTFDGGDDYVEVGGLSTLLNGTATLTFWIRTTQSGDDTAWQAPGIAGIEEAGGADDIFWGWIDAGGRIGISVGNDYAADQKSSSSINDGNWHHVALTRDASSGATRIFVDGSLETAGVTGSGTIGNAFASIGRIEDTGGSPEYFDGDLDEVRVFDDLLDESDVQSVMNDTHSCAFCAAGADLSDSFEDGDLGPWQSQGGPGSRAGVSTQTAGDGNNSMFLRHGEIFVRSPNIDFSSVTSADLSLWIRRGADSFSENPEAGEDLEVQYRTSANNWATLATFPGGGTAGEIFEPTYSLPADAFHANFRIRFHLAGGSGSDFDYWHVDNICLTSMGSGDVDHFAITHDGTAVTCGEEAITITGHNPGDQPRDPGNVTVSLAAINQDTGGGEGTWARVIAGSGTLSDAAAGDGAATYTFPGNGEVSVTLAFNYTTVSEATDPETVNFDVNGGNEGAGEDPDLVVSLSGFRITDGSGNAVTIPEQIAGKPTDTAPGAISLALQAIRASDNDPSVCEPYFDDGDDVEVELGGECSDPGTCAGNALEVTSNGNTTAVATSDDDGGTGTAAYTPVTLRFGANAEAPLVLEYDDAGRIQLHARHNPIDNGTGTPPVVEYVTGSSNPWVTRPFGFEVEVPADDGTTGAGGTILAVAGDDFDTTVRAVAWQAADDGDDDGQPDAGADLSGNATTPNFGNEAAPETVTLTPVVAAPAGGSDGGLTGALFDSFGSGSETHGVSWSEVGHVHLDAGITDGNYLGGGDATGRADTVGRFIPADFDVAVAADGDLDAACNATYTYTGQAAGYVSAMEPQLTITARNRSGGTTTNYRGAYARLAAAGIDVAEPAADGTETGLEGSPVAVTGNIDTGSLVANGDGTLTHTFADTDRFTYDKVNNARIDPFEPDIDLDVTAVADTDGVAADPAVLPVTVEPAAAHEIRFGRLVVESAAGSELAPIGQPVRAEYWSSSTWQPHADDSCTSLALATGVRLDNDQGGPVDGTQPIPVGGGSTDLTTNTPDPVNLAGGEAVLTFAETGDGNTGWVDTTLTLDAGLPWLRHDWDDADGGGDGPYDDLPVGRVTFGIHSGNSNWIHFRRTQ